MQIVIQFMLKCFKSKILDNQLRYFKTKQRLRSTNLHPPFFQKLRIFITIFTVEDSKMFIKKTLTLMQILIKVHVKISVQNEEIQLKQYL